MEGAADHPATSISGLSLIQPSISVTNSGSIAIASSVVQSSVNGKKVLVTPLRAHQKTVQQLPLQQQPVLNQNQRRQDGTVIQKLLLKAVTKNRKNPKMFAVRNIDTAVVTASGTPTLKKFL